MKVLFDPIYSAQPHKCSSAAKYKKIAARLLAARDDTFIYWLIPDWADEAALEWLPDDKRVKYFKTPCTKDRVREYQIYGSELEQYVSFFGKTWDYDVLITMRTSQVPTMRASMHCSRIRSMTWLKKVILLEEMAIMDFRKTVPISHAEVQDALTALGYLSADLTYITANHVRDGIIKEGRSIFAPSRGRQLDSKIRLVNPAVIDTYEAKKQEYRFKRGEEPFCLGFVGRLGKSMTRIRDVYDIMDKNWIMKGDKGFKVLISTLTQIQMVKPPDFVVIENNNREQFWARLRKDMHLVISLSIDAEFSLGLIETVALGVPLVIARYDWTEGLLGKEYPFFADTTAQVHGIIKAFHDDYETCYARFIAWREEVFKKRFQPGGLYARNLYDDLMAEIGTYDEITAARMAKDHAVKRNSELISTVFDAIEGRDEFVLHEVMTELEEAGKLRHFGQKTESGVNPSAAMTFYTPFHEWKIMFKAFGGWTDASTQLGHFKRAK